jgi:two-component sensor histidine kinase
MRLLLSTSLRNYYEVSGFIQQQNGTVWVKGLQVLGRFLEKERQFQLVYNGYESEQSISYSRVNNLFEDREANIWVATNTNGLYKFNPAAQFFTNIRQINRRTKVPGDGSMMSFLQSRDGTLLAGAWGDGLYRFDSNYNMLPINIRGFDEVITPFAWSLSYSRDSNIIWMGSQPGIFAINREKHTSSYHNPSIMKNRTVRQAVEDKYGNLWMGTQSLGLFKWAAEKGKRKFDDGVSQYTTIPVTQIQKIITDKKGYVWVGTSGYGAYVIDPANDKVILHFGMKESPERKLLWNQVPSILQYDDTTIVIAANGIHLFNTRQQKIIKTIKMPESIPGLITAVEKDTSGYLWISTTNGIFRLNPRNKIFIHFDRGDGIANDLFIIAASYILPDGRIIFGADNQFVVFDPQQVKINYPAPDVAITGFKLMNESLLVDSLLKRDNIELSPEDNSIAVEFSGLNYNGTYIIKYKLEGLDKEWKRADQFNQAIYSYLPPRHYTFMVKSEDAEGNPSKNITKFVIRVKPPFWKTWWFFGLMVFAVVGLFFWFDKQRMQKLRATESIRRRIATSLTEDMSNSLSSINISSELAKTKIDVDKERTKEYIAQISETSNRMVQAMYDMVWSIDPKNDTMLNTIERMKSFAVETESLYDIDIVFDIDEKAADLNLDMAHRYELLSIFKEAIINAAKHSTARHVQVSLRLKSSRFFMLIEDDGKGFDVDKTILGRGINDIRRRASDINASLHIESEKNTGTIVKLEMPV